MNHRWLGGTLTNWKTVSNSISRLKKLDEQLSDGATGLTKKERLNLEREQLPLQTVYNIVLHEMGHGLGLQLTEPPSISEIIDPYISIKDDEARISLRIKDSQKNLKIF